MALSKKPTRSQLLAVVFELQKLVGEAKASYCEDQYLTTPGAVIKPLDDALELCIKTTRFDPPRSLS